MIDATIQPRPQVLSVKLQRATLASEYPWSIGRKVSDVCYERGVAAMCYHQN